MSSSSAYFKKNLGVVWSLALTDLKARYAASTFGTFWVFAMPLTNILLIWFAFSAGLKTSSVDGQPFILWLVAGMVPWLFFSEALSSATSSIVEKNYLVKKVVFAVELLPLIKIVVSSLIFLFLLSVLIVMLFSFGYVPQVGWAFIPYYALCTVALLLALSWTTSSIVVFYRDLNQAVNILLQVGFWVTPIIWNPDNLPEKFRFIVHLNPLNYIISGLRNSLFQGATPLDNLQATLYFWGLVAGLCGLSLWIFRKLRPHFADLL